MEPQLKLQSSLFACRRLNCWNSLRNDVCNASSVYVFKRLFNVQVWFYGGSSAYFYSIVSALQIVPSGLVVFQ